MKRTLIAVLSLVLSTSVGADLCSVKAQMLDRFTLSLPVLARPTLDLSDRVVITPQVVTLMRGKAGEAYPDRKMVAIQSPRISGIKDPVLLEKVRTAVSLKAVSGQSLEEIRAELQENTWLSDIRYRVNYNQKFLLDLTYVIEGSGAYPSQYERHVVVDLKAGKKLRSNDVFRLETLGMIAAQVDKVMQAEIKKTIAQVNRDDLDIRPYLNEAKFRIKQVDNFSLSDQGIIFRYDFDFPHVMKAAEPKGRYFFTYAQLKTYIRKDGPLGQFLP